MSTQVSIYNNLSMEYALIAIFVVLLFMKKSVRRALDRLKHGDKWSKISTNDEYNNLPGPPHLPIIGALHHIMDQKNVINVLIKFARMYGPVARFKFFFTDFVVLNTAETAQILLSSTDFDHTPKSPFFYDKAVGPVLGNGVITSTGQRWKSHRKLLSPAFSYKSFQNYFKMFNTCSKRLVNELDDLFVGAGNNEPKQINAAIHHAGIQIISEAVMGLKLCSDEDGSRFYKAIRRYKEIFGLRATAGYLLLDFLWNLHPLKKEQDNAVKTMKDITFKMIEVAKQNNGNEESISAETNDQNENGSKGRTMIEEMLRTNTMTDTDIMYEVNTMIFAGFETTSATVHYLMFLLALNQEQQKAAREEVDAAFADPMKCPNGDLTYDAVADLKYLERCVNETLRNFPPIFALLRKIEKPLKISETLEIPAGTNVAIPPLSFHTNPEYFPDPEKFDPDRFLPENVRQRHPCAFIPFSAGPRMCLGMKFALMEAKTMAAFILRNFEIYTTDGRHDVTLLPDIFLTPERDYNFILKKRFDLQKKD